MASQEDSVAPARGLRSVSSSNINGSVQQSNHSDSRRTSAVMGPPPLPNNSLPNSPRSPHAMMQRSPSSQGQVQEQGPLRHPRPLTAAELHLELEKEQESIVNRLTRELSALRAQTASVASTTSSTSDLFTTSQNGPDYHYAATSGASIIPTSARRHRSSSNLSTRSARSIRDAVTRDAATSSVVGVAAPRDSDRSHQTSARQSLDIQRPDTSRQNSYNLSTSTSTGNMSMYRSTSSATSPYGPPPGYSHGHRASGSASHPRDPSIPANESRSPSFGSAQAAARYEEAALHKQEMETIKRENEGLKQKIRDLERQLAGGSLSGNAPPTNPSV